MMMTYVEPDFQVPICGQTGDLTGNGARTTRQSRVNNSYQSTSFARRLAQGRSLKLGVFGLGFVENRDVSVGVLPESEEILVRRFRFGLFSRQSQRSA